MAQVYMYTFHERMWHWIQALVILAMIWTGIEIHAPHRISILGFNTAVLIHDFLGVTLIINAALGLLYHLFTGEIGQFIPQPNDFLSAGIRQAKYYVSGIFRNEPHPFEKDPRRKLNPLQKITYFAILNFLLPVQVLSGIILLSGHRWPALLNHFGGLKYIAPFHTLVAWLFLAFVLVHIYLSTTGSTPLSNFKAMLSGWEELEDHLDPMKGDDHGGRTTT